MYYKVWNEINHPFPNFNDVTLEVYWAYDYLPKLELKLIHFNKRGPNKAKAADMAFKPAAIVVAASMLLLWNHTVGLSHNDNKQKSKTLCIFSSLTQFIDMSIFVKIHKKVSFNESFKNLIRWSIWQRQNYQQLSVERRTNFLNSTCRYFDWFTAMYMKVMQCPPIHFPRTVLFLFNINFSTKCFDMESESR